MGKRIEIIDRAATWLDVVLREPDGPALFASPYLSFDVCRALATAARKSSHPFVLLTALDPSAVANGYLSISGLRLIMESGVDVRHVERLHAKTFLIGSQGATGSANLTGAGLGSSARPNRELGIVLTSDQVIAARKLMEDWPARNVVESDLSQLEEEARQVGRLREFRGRNLDSATSLQLAEGLLVEARESSRTLWVKLEYGDPALDAWRERSWFASPKKGRPSFRPGDFVLICAKDTHDCYAVLEVVGEANFRPSFYAEWALKNDPTAVVRWPWINPTMPRLVPESLLELKLSELGVNSGGLQNGHVRLTLEQFSAAVRALARLSSGV